MNPPRILLLIAAACCGAACTAPQPAGTKGGHVAEASRHDAASENEGLRTSIAVIDVHRGDDAISPGDRAAALRIIELFPRDSARSDVPKVGWADGILARGVLGTVPVEADGSALFEVPPSVELCIQTLDEGGRALQTLRSGIRLRAGQRLFLVGAREGRDGAAPAPAGPVPLALRKPPAPFQPESCGSYPLTFARLVQPVLDRHCIGCHDGRSGRPDLRSRLFETGNIEEVPQVERLCGIESLNNGWTCSYVDLRQHASKLMQMLDCGHGGGVPDADRHCIALWLDCNSPFYGAYHDADAQARGQMVVPKVGFIPEFEN
jgi:hypothetical protein